MSILLSLKDISKSFPGVKALSGVDFSVAAGEIHALMGENGAGKSTLVKIITGVYQRDSGTMQLNGVDVNPASPREAEAVGISTVYQEVNLIPELSVAENICLGRYPRKFGFIDWKATNTQARQALQLLDIDIDVTRNLSTYSLAIQQMAAIARALAVDSKLLILDEPTSSLDDREVEDLFKVLRKLRERDMGIVFITHFLDQVYSISDSITILRDGTLVGTYKASELPRLEMVATMIGKDVQDVAAMETAKHQGHATDTTFLTAESIESNTIGPVDFNVNKGEMLGFAGLLGSGRSEVARMVFGVDKLDSGHFKIDANYVHLTSPRSAISKGIAMTTEDRKYSGIIPELSIRENIMLALQAREGVFHKYTMSQQYEIANKYIKLLNIKTPSADQLIKNLSGGNQQKVLLARWMVLNPQLFILDEPTRGIDVGAKAEIEKLMAELCKQGTAIIFISSELEEVVKNCDRVMVLRDQHKVGEIAGDDLNIGSIMKMIAE